MEAYETRVADDEKKKLMVPLPIEEELKLKTYTSKREWGASWWEQFSILFRRGLKERRHDYFSWLRITQVLTTAVILGLLWWQSDSDSPKDLQDQVREKISSSNPHVDRLLWNPNLGWSFKLLVTSQPRHFSPLQAGLLFFISVFWGFFPVFTAIFTFPQERAMLNKERAADMYRISAYFVARTSSDIPLDLLLPVLFLVVVYFMAGLRKSAGPYFLTMLTVFLCIVAAQVRLFIRLVSNIETKLIRFCL